MASPVISFCRPHLRLPRHVLPRFLQLLVQFAALRGHALTQLLQLRGVDLGAQGTMRTSGKD